MKQIRCQYFSGVHLDNLTTSEGLEWSGLGGQAGSIGRERLTSNDFDAELRLASRTATVGSPPLLQGPLSPSPMPPTASMVVNKEGGGSFFTTLVNSAKKSVMDYAVNPHHQHQEEGEEDLQEDIDPGHDSIPLAAMEKVSV